MNHHNQTGSGPGSDDDRNKKNIIILGLKILASILFVSIIFLSIRLFNKNFSRDLSPSLSSSVPTSQIASNSFETTATNNDTSTTEISITGNSEIFEETVFDRTDPVFLGRASRLEQDIPGFAGKGLDIIAVVETQSSLEENPQIADLVDKYDLVISLKSSPRHPYFREEYSGDDSFNTYLYYRDLGFYFDPLNEYAITPDIEKAMYWYEIAVADGDLDAAIALGDLYYWGKDLTEDKEKAVFYYELASKLPTRNGIPFARLADCYARGHGVVQNDERANKLFWESYILYGNWDASYALFQRIDTLDFDEMQKLSFYKMLASAHYYPESNGLYDREFSSEKVQKLLFDAWEKGEDSVAARNKAASEGNDRFSSEFIRDVKKQMYAWSLDFDEQYIFTGGIRNEEDAAKIVFVPVEDRGVIEIEHRWNRGGYIEADFDNDGIDEILLRGTIEGTGRRFYLGFYRPNANGEYEKVYQTGGSAWDSRSSLIHYKDDRYYVLFTGRVNLLHPMPVRSIENFDGENRSHVISITPSGWSKDHLKSLLIFKDISEFQEEFHWEYASHSVVRSAHEMGLFVVHEDHGGHDFAPELKLVDTYPYYYSADRIREVYEKADIFNDGKQYILQKVIEKSDFQGLHFADYHFNILNDEKEITEEDEANIFSKNKYESLFPAHARTHHKSYGNVGEFFPIGSNVVQFGCFEYEENTYTYFVHRTDEAYLYDCYLYKDGEAKLVSRDIYLMQPTNFVVRFNLS